MNRLRNLLIVPAMLVLVLAAVGPPAAAHGDSHDVDKTATSSSSSDDSMMSSSEPLTEDSLHQRTDQMMQAMLAKHKNRQSSVARTRKCQAAKHGLETKLGNLQKNAAKHKALIDKVYAEALAYQQKNNLNPSDFSTLTAAADAAQAKAAQSIGVLNGLSVNLDCANTNVAANVANFKVAGKQVRDDLLTYRKAVIAVLKALANVKQPEGAQ